MPYWLVTSKSIASALGFDTRVVNLGVLAPMAVGLEERTRLTCDKLLDRPLQSDY